MPLGPGNHLLYGDNATVMRDLMGSQSVDLIYLDPPFKSDKNYNLIYSTMTGKPVPEQAEAFCDTWTLNTSKADLLERLPNLMREAGVDSAYLNFWITWVSALQGSQASLLAYLYYMVERLLWMKPILRDTGSIYLHCDPAASHYIKVMMDGIFGHENFRNEIIWKRTSAHSSAKRYGPVHDVILFYSKSDTFTWNPQFQPHDPEYIASHYRNMTPGGRRYTLSDLTAAGTRKGSSGQPWKGFDPTDKGNHWKFTIENLDKLDAAGRIYWSKKQGAWPRYIRYLDEVKGTALQDVWTDIPPVNAKANERLGYPTQKPIALMKRIVGASSKPGDVVFDPFCGCGTTVYATQEVGGRQWIGCDIAILAVKLIREILGERYRLAEGSDFRVTGIPNSVESATALFERDPFQFEHWAVERVGGFPTRRSGDRGIDGKVYYETSTGLRSMVLSVKGGQIKPEFVRELSGVVRDEPDADLGGFICLKTPTRKMLEAARDAGDFTYRGVRYPRVQILTVKQILEDKIDFRSPTKVGSKLTTGQRNLAFD
jgi:DNA modification methylase